MRKNILVPKTANELSDRTTKLKATTAPLWGSMTATEMLHHCNKALKATLEGEPSTHISTAKQKAWRFLFLNILSKFPKNVRAPKRLQVAGTISAEQFAVEKQKFIDYINQFATNNKTIAIAHPVFGKLNTNEWGVVTWMHLDHHLRQFGV